MRAQQLLQQQHSRRPIPRRQPGSRVLAQLAAALLVALLLTPHHAAAAAALHAAGGAGSRGLQAAAAPPDAGQPTPAQQTAARWGEHYRRAQAAAAAGQPLPQPPAPAPGDFAIPVPPAGTDVPAETQMPLFSPDQLRMRHAPIPGVPPESQVISLAEQMQQAAALGVSLTQAQLEDAAPLLSQAGPVAVPERRAPGEWPEGYLALCAIVKDQAAELREWLEYHRWLGVGRVYVYDNNSTVPLAGALADFLHSGFVEYAFFPGMPRYRDLFRTSSQWWAYHDCLSRFRHRHRWIGFIDVDEFIVLQEPQYQQRPSWQALQQQAAAAAAAHASSQQQPEAQDSKASPAASLPDINTFLQAYEGHGGLALNWVVFGSSGHVSRPQGGVLVNYHACLPSGQEQNSHVKVIAHTGRALSVGDDPHRVYYTDQQHASTVNELGQQVAQARSTGAPSHTKIALYHYLTKSEGEYMQKMRRGSAAGNYKAPEFFTAINALATATCTRAMPLGLACCPSVARELGAAGVARVKQRLAALQRQQHEQQQQEPGHAGSNVDL